MFKATLAKILVGDVYDDNQNWHEKDIQVTIVGEDMVFNALNDRGTFNTVLSLKVKDMIGLVEGIDGIVEKVIEAKKNV